MNALDRFVEVRPALRSLRQKMGVSAKDMATRLGVAISWFYQIENPAYPQPSEVVCQRILKEYNIGSANVEWCAPEDPRCVSTCPHCGGKL